MIYHSPDWQVDTTANNAAGNAHRMRVGCGASEMGGGIFA